MLRCSLPGEVANVFLDAKGRSTSTASRSYPREPTKSPRSFRSAGAEFIPASGIQVPASSSLLVLAVLADDNELTGALAADAQAEHAFALAGDGLGVSEAGDGFVIDEGDHVTFFES